MLVGVRPTGSLHLGHWDSVIVPGREGATVLIANMHAPNVTHEQVVVLFRQLSALGCLNLEIQSGTFDARATVVYFRLLALVSTGELSRMIQFRKAEADDKTAHLFCYPVLQTVDIMGYDSVGVGEDQSQHLDYARDWIARYNRAYETDFPIPEAKIIGGRVMDLREPTRKMSKSHPEGCLFLDDDADTIRKKIRKANSNDAGTINLCNLHKRFVGAGYQGNTLGLKNELADALIALLATTPAPTGRE